MEFLGPTTIAVLRELSKSATSTDPTSCGYLPLLPEPICLNPITQTRPFLNFWNKGLHLEAEQTMLVFWLVVLALLISDASSRQDTDYNFRYSTNARQRFNDKFNATCAKFPFVSLFTEMLERPISSDDKFLIFVFHEGNSGGGGGLGDRVAGMITALAYAIRTNRRFLIQGDEAFEEAFRPYNPRDVTNQSTEKHTYSWNDWEWSGWSRGFASNMIKLHCVNPKPGMYCI